MMVNAIKNRQLFLSTVLVVLFTLVLSGCGFALRGYHNQQMQLPATAPTVVVDAVTAEAAVLKTQLQQQLNQLYKKQPEPSAITLLAPSNTIELNRVTLNRYELLGIITEVRLVLTAEVTYQFIIQTGTQTGQAKTLTKQLQVQRSYQYSKATVNADNPQEEIVEKWLYEALAAQINEQYLVLTQNNIAVSSQNQPNKLMTN